MIVILKDGATKEQCARVEKKLTELGFKTHPIYGEIKTVIGAIGDKRSINTNIILALDAVESVVPIMKPYKLAGRELYKERSIIDLGDGVTIGGNEIVIMAGPCAVEGEKEYLEVAQKVSRAGAKILRGGAYKPRSSPYSFQGMEEDGLKIMAEAKALTGAKLVTEVVDPRDVALVNEYVDMFQIGARNMQNFQLLKEVGAYKKPVLLKRGLAATISEWLMAAEYIMSEGNDKVIFCERGIRTYETETRNTMDISAIPIIKSKSHLPIIADPSHATGHANLVSPLAKAAIAAGADGLMIEVHHDPINAMSDGEQSLTPEQYEKLVAELIPVAEAVGKTM